MSEPRVTPEMQDAGLQALLGSVAAEKLEELGVDPRQLVARIYSEMAKLQWLPIQNAPRSSTSSVMLGYFGPQGFTVGIGRFVPPDDDVSSGEWSTQAWWGKPPTHWMPLPPAPQRVEA